MTLINDGKKKGANRGPRKIVNFFSLSTLVGVSLVMRFLSIFDTQLLFLYVLPQGRQFPVRGYFCKTQASSRIPLMISM